jgi:diadenosine tetraphosphate (Ap4A) HIT family hydrolase
MEAQCPFCNLPESRIWFNSKHSLAFLDGFPITEGHALIIPKRHVQSVFELPEDASWKKFGQSLPGCESC